MGNSAQGLAISKNKNQVQHFAAQGRRGRSAANWISPGPSSSSGVAETINFGLGGAPQLYAGPQERRGFSIPTCSSAADTSRPGVTAA